MTQTRNDLSIYDAEAQNWWDSDTRWVRILQNMVPGRLSWFDRKIDWSEKYVLDLGCAGGFMAEALDDRGATVTGIDPATEAIEAAKHHASKTNRTIQYDVGFGENLPYDTNAFDAVVCVDVLEHVTDLDQVVREVARVLKPDGRFLFDTINRNPLAQLATITLAEDVLGLLPKGSHDPEMFIKPGELRQSLTKAGFDVEAFTGLGPRGINKRLDLTFGRIPLTSVIYMGTATLRP